MTRLNKTITNNDLRFPELRSTEAELIELSSMEEHQVKIPGTQMSMIALEHGIQCTWLSHYKVRDVARLLRLPDGYLPSNLLAFGYPDDGGSPRKPGKRELKDIVFYNTGGNLTPADRVPRWKWE